jgi:type I thyroxine 5'-deiodinase
MWPMATPDGAVFEEPRTLAERCDHATHCASALQLQPLTTLVDDLGDAANNAYEAWPDRLVLLDARGRVAYRSAPGPYGFLPDELAKALDLELARGATPTF